MKNGIVTTCAGSFGRLGNSLFQYAVGRAYAESIDAEFRSGNWIGRQLFKGMHEPSSENLFLPVLEDEKLDGRTNVHLHGYFQRLEHIALLRRSKLKEWFQPMDHWKRKGHDLILHKRRTDYIGNDYYAVVSDKSYDDALKTYGYDASQAKVYSCENPESKQYDDFFEIMHSKVIFRSNSTFSWWAAALSDAKVYSPVVENRTGWIDCEFVEGNHPKIMQLFEDLYLKD